MSLNNYQDIINKLKEEKDEQLTSNSKVLIIDGTNTFFRSFSVINHVNPQLIHIGGLTGFLKSIGYIVRMIKPTKVVILFDGQGSNTNKKYLYPEYKANRDIQTIKNWQFDSKEEENESMINQLERLIEYLKQLPIHLLAIDKIEADDVIGYLCNKFTNKITIMSSDRDFLQLVNEKTEVYSPTKKQFYSPKEVFDEYNIHPYNYIYYKMLLGDKGDNVPGIKGIGPKKIMKLFPELKEEKKLSLNEIFDICDKHENIISHKHQLEVNYKLMNLSTPNIPDSDLETIDNVVNTSNIYFDKIKFIQMYNNDKLGESIQNLEFWLDNFKYLINF